LLGLKFDHLFSVFAEHVQTKYHAEPAFITMNMPKLVDVLEKQGLVNPIVCANVNKIGFRMSGGVTAYRELIASGRCRAVAMSIFASGAIPAKEAVEWVCGLEGLQSIVFGASSPSHIKQTKELIENYWGIKA
jgi:phosphoribosylformimino-5-aminoimidazole carboxamide ribonucleotide (ProFAR) isomerase